MDDFADKLERVRQLHLAHKMEYGNNPEKLQNVRICLSHDANAKIFFDAKLVSGNSYVITDVIIDENLPHKPAKKAQWKQESGSWYARPKKAKGT